jgi:7-cyano-7-deazaguanine synthase
LSKKEIVLLAKELNCLDLMKHTMTCYKGSTPPCKKCSACLLREKGFKEARIEDPLLKGKYNY